MLSRIISEELIQLNVQAKDWEDAIRKSAAPLLKKRKITQEYIDKIIEITQTTGPYIVITTYSFTTCIFKVWCKRKGCGDYCINYSSLFWA